MQFDDFGGNNTQNINNNCTNNTNIIKKKPIYGNYENFNINQMKLLNNLKLLTDKAKLLLLKDGRLLTYYNKMINVYNLNNNDIDIVYNVESQYKDITDLIQMDDENIIVAFFDIYIYMIKEKEIKIVCHYILTICDKFYQLSNDIFLIKDLDKPLNFKRYHNGELSTIDEKPIKIKNINKIIEISDKELSLYCEELSIFSGYSSHIIFYDKKKEKKIKTLNIGKINNSKENVFCLINENNLICANKKNIIVIINLQQF